MSKSTVQLADELKSKFGQTLPDGDGWSWDWVPDPLAVEAANRLIELEKELKKYESDY